MTYMVKCIHWSWQECPLRHNEDTPCPIPDDEVCWIIAADEWEEARK